MSDYVKVCAEFDGSGVCISEVWKLADQTITFPAIDWEVVSVAFTGGLLIWAGGVAIGILLNVVRKARSI